VYAPQAHYSQVARIGRTLYIAGQLGLDEKGELVGPGDARAQARQAWRNLIAILAHYGATSRHLAKTTTFITTGPIVPRSAKRAMSSLPSRRIRRAPWSSSRAWPSQGSWSKSKRSPSLIDPFPQRGPYWPLTGR